MIMEGFIVTRENTGQTASEIIEAHKRSLNKQLIMGQLRTNLSPNKRNELLREFNTANDLLNECNELVDIIQNKRNA